MEHQPWFVSYIENVKVYFCMLNIQNKEVRRNVNRRSNLTAMSFAVFIDKKVMLVLFTTSQNGFIKLEQHKQVYVK